MTVFILKNQQNQYLNKEKAWVSSGDASQLFRSPHYDTALNQLIELNAKDYTLRAAAVACELDSKGRPVLAPPEADVTTPPDHLGDESESESESETEYA